MPRRTSLPRGCEGPDHGEARGPRSASGHAAPRAGLRRRRGWVGGILALFFLSACASSPGLEGLEADAVYERAVAHLEAEEWNEAIEALDYFLFVFPGEPRSAEARMSLADAHFQKGEYITSAAEYERFLQLFPSHGRAPEASLAVCRSYEELSPVPQRDQAYTERAVDACRNTMNEFAGMTVAEEARDIQRAMIERLAEREYQDAFWYERRGYHDSAILRYQELVDFYPQTSWAPRGFLGLYRSYLAIEWDTEAQEARARLLSNYPDSPEAAQVRDGAGGGAGGPGSNP